MESSFVSSLRLTCAAVLVAAASLAGCDGTATTGSQTLTLHSESAMDGVVTWHGGASYTGDAAAATAIIGDTADDSVMRLVLSFSLAPLLSGAQVESATLRVYQTSAGTGTSYGESKLGDVYLDHVSYAAFAPELFDPTTTIDANMGSMASSYVPNSWHQFVVTGTVSDDLATGSTGRSQYKLYHHYESDKDKAEDSDGWSMSESLTNSPQLVIVYH